MNDTEREDIVKLDDDRLEAVSGGGIPYYSPSQYSLIFNSVTPFILKILAAAQPSYNYVDTGANFMSLVYEWGEYHLHVDGKDESDVKCRAILLVLEAKGFDMKQIGELLDEAAVRYE